MYAPARTGNIPAINSMGDARSSTSVRMVPTATGLVLLDTSSNCLWAYNDSARHVWELIERGGLADDIVADFTLQYGIPDDIARSDVGSILRQWRSQGLVHANGAHEPLSKPVAKIATDRRWEP